MADFTIASVEIRTDGWSADVTLTGEAGEAGNMTYDFGTPGSTSTSKFYLTVVSEGYNASGVLGTVTRTVYGTDVVRKPHPNDSDLDETDDSGNLVVRVALSDFVYDDDQDGGAGTSGTDPTVSVAAGWVTNTGDSDQNIGSINASVTNSSTLDYPQVGGQWDPIAGSVTADRVKSDFVLAANVFHRSGIAACLFDATGQTSAVADTGNAGTMGTTQRTRTSLYMQRHAATIPLAQFTQAELINCDFKAYPVVGDADSILDTSSETTLANECLGYNRAVIVCDKSDALDDAVYVSTSGNDTTGDGSSGNPYATIAKGVVEGNIVYLQAGTHAAGSSLTRKASDEWVIVQPAPGLDETDVTVQLGTTRNTKCSRLTYQGVTVTLSGTSSWADGEDADNTLRFEDCVFDGSGVGTPTVGPLYRLDVTYFLNCCGDLSVTEWKLKSFSSARIAAWFDGCIFDESSASASEIDIAHRFVCNTTSGAVALYDKAPANAAPAMSNRVWANNKIVDMDGSDSRRLLSVGNQETVTHCAVVAGNVVEATVTASAAALFVFADSNTLSSNHILIWHNTLAGERFNGGYLDTGTSSATAYNWSIVGNSFEQYNTKHDTFGTADASRVGYWPVLYGVGFVANGAETTLGFCNEYEGLYSSSIMATDPDDSGTTPCDPAYTDDNSATTDSSGDGDYTPLDSGDIWEAMPAGYGVLSYDLFGTQYVDDGTDNIGAIQFYEEPPVSSGESRFRDHQTRGGRPGRIRRVGGVS